MQLSTNLRNLYTPIQPTVRQSADAVEYREFLPDENLRPFIYCYWELKTKEELKEAFHYRVVADGCIDIFFELNKTEDNFVMGFCKKFMSFELPNQFHYVGVRFLPTMFPQIFGINASDLSNQFAELKNIVPEVSDFISSNFKTELEKDNIKTLLDEYFLEKINTTKFDNDSRLYDALDAILTNFGMINIETDIQTGLSPRQLRRIFKYYIGDTPKVFSKVVRFQNILKAKPSKQSLRQNKLFYDVGYFDQSHFIKEFKNFYGVTPSKAFGR